MGRAHEQLVPDSCDARSSIGNVYNKAFSPRDGDALTAAGPVNAMVVETRAAGNGKAFRNSPESEGYDHFIVDSGASHSVVHNRHAFEVIDTSRRIQLYSGANVKTDGRGMGTISVMVADENGNARQVRRHDVVWCPNFRVNLLSLRKEVMEYGSTVSFGTKTSGNALILSSGHSVPFFDR